MALLEMEWRDVLFASWPVDPAAVDARLPDGLEPDTRDGRAWLSVVPFVMDAVRPCGLPRSLGLRFPELNLRTYVTAGGDPGVYFFNLDAGDPLGVVGARAVFGLPYYNARMAVEREGDGRVRFRSERDHPGADACRFDATFEPTGEATPAAGLTAFLVERYHFVVESRAGLLRGDVRHPPWEVTGVDAEFRENDLFAADGFEHPGGDPHLAYSPGVPVRAGRPRRVRP